MRDTLNKLWAEFFVAVVLIPVAGVVGGLIGTQAGLTFWIMGMAAHWPMLSATDLPFRRRLMLWLMAMIVGVITAAALGTVLVATLVDAFIRAALSCVPVTLLFWLGAAIRWAPVIVACVVSGILVRRSVRRGQASSPLVTPRPGTNNPGRQMHVRPTQAPERQPAPRTSNRVVREVFWFVGCVVVVGAFVVIVIAIGAEVDGSATIDWTAVTATVFSLFGLVTLARAVAWLIRDGGRRLRYWPEVVLIAGVCLLAYGGSGVIDSDRDQDSDRYLATIGAGLAITGTLIRRRLAPK